jgi:two-component sensor histidine kinase
MADARFHPRSLSEMIFSTSRFSLFSNKNRLFWLLQCTGWGLMLVVALENVRSNNAELLPFIWYRNVFGFVLSAFVLRPALRWVRRRSQTRTLPRTAFLVGLVLLFGLTDAYGSLWTFDLISPLQFNDGASRLYVDSTTSLRCGIYGFWVSIYVGINQFIDTTRERLRLSQLEIAARESELRLLRAQVNPHFLFNALNTIIAEAEDPQRVTTITHALAEYLRFSLEQTNGQHPLGQELDALENYLRVEKIRFEERFEYTLVADAAARRRMVPGALVQPLLENAIKYGQHTSAPPLRLAISAHSRADGSLSLIVENSGHWIEPGSSDSTGLGLANLRRRLELLHDGRATLKIETEAGRVRICVDLPPLASTSSGPK